MTEDMPDLEIPDETQGPVYEDSNQLIHTRLDEAQVRLADGTANETDHLVSEVFGKEPTSENETYIPPINSSVNVERTSGDIDSGWTVAEIDEDNGKVKVVKKFDGTESSLFKIIDIKDLEKLNPKPESIHEEDTAKNEKTDIDVSTSESISDLVNIDSQGRGHISGSRTGPDDIDNRSKNGQFLSQYEMENIAANQDLIRNNLPAEETAVKTLDIPKQTDEIPNPESLDELNLAAIRQRDALQDVAERGEHNVEEEKTKNSELSLFKRVTKNFKFMTLFKSETVRRRSLEVLDGMRSEPPPYSREEFDGAVKDIDAIGAEATNKAIIEMVNNPDLRRSSDLVIEGEGGENEHEAVARVRAGITEALLPYLQETNDPNMSSEDLQSRTEAYQDKIRTLIDGVMQENPDFNREALSVMTDTSIELANKARVYLGHEDGIEKLNEQLSTMKISLGEMQIGPNADYNTQYLEKTLDRMHGRAVDSMLARASFSVGTFVLSGAMAHGMSEFAKQTGSRSAAKYGGAVVGGLLFGPVGVGVGLTASTLASATFARRLARNQAMDRIGHIGVEQGDSSSQAKSELFNKLSLDTLDFSDIERVYMENTIEQTLDNGTTERVLKSNISTEEEFNLARMLAATRVRLTIENNSIPPINLLSSETPASYLKERVLVLQHVTQLEDSLRQRYKDQAVLIPTGRVDDEGIYETKPANIDDLFSQLYAEEATVIEANIEKTRIIREEFVKSEGRRAALIGGVASAFGGITAFGVTDLISHGITPSAMDGMGLKSGNTEVIQRAVDSGANKAPETLSSSSGNITAHFNSINGSKVEVFNEGHFVAIDTPTGKHIEVPLNNDGGISAKDLLQLKRNGVNLSQETQINLQTQNVSTDNVFSQLGSKPMEVNSWLDNGSPGSNGTELETHIAMGDQGQIIIEQDPGIAFNTEQNFNLTQMANEGKLNAYLVNNGQTVSVPMSVGPDGNMIATIPSDSPLNAMFGQVDGKITYLGNEWHIGIATDNTNQYNSVSSLIGPGSVAVIPEQVPVSATNLNFDFTRPEIKPQVPINNNDPDYILGGLVPTPEKGVLYKDQEDRRDVNRSGNPPISTEPINHIEVNSDSELSPNEDAEVINPDSSLDDNIKYLQSRKRTTQLQLDSLNKVNASGRDKQKISDTERRLSMIDDMIAAEERRRPVVIPALSSVTDSEPSQENKPIVPEIPLDTNSPSEPEPQIPEDSEIAPSEISVPTNPETPNKDQNEIIDTLKKRQLQAQQELSKSIDIDTPESKEKAASLRRNIKLFQDLIDFNNQNNPERKPTETPTNPNLESSQTSNTELPEIPLDTNSPSEPEPQIPEDSEVSKVESKEDSALDEVNYDKKMQELGERRAAKNAELNKLYAEQQRRSFLTRNSAKLKQQITEAENQLKFLDDLTEFNKNSNKSR